VNVDVLVVGAGPAGCAAAAAIAPHRSVLLVDPIEVPGWRIGETLPGAARRVLQAIGAWEGFEAAKHPSAPLKVSRWGSEEAVELDSFRDPDGAGWRIDRARFEADLRCAARMRGATLTTPARVQCLSRHAGAWVALLDDGGSVHARLVVDAGGRRSRLLRPHGQRRVFMDRLACVHQRVRTRGPADPSTYTQSVPDGWWYTSLLPGGERLVAFHGEAGDRGMRDLLASGPLAAGLALPGLYEAIGRVEIGSASAVVACSAASAAASVAGEGWFAAGDCAIALDPLSSQGLLNAMITGVEAGEAALAVLGGDALAGVRLAERAGRIWRAYLDHHRLYYGMERRWQHEPFWRSRIAAPSDQPAFRSGRGPAMRAW